MCKYLSNMFMANNSVLPLRKMHGVHTMLVDSKQLVVGLLVAKKQLIRHLPWHVDTFQRDLNNPCTSVIIWLWVKNMYLLV